MDKWIVVWFNQAEGTLETVGPFKLYEGAALAHARLACARKWIVKLSWPD